MITKRARKWLSRGALVTTLVVVAILAGSTWVLSSSLRAHLLDPVEPEAAIVVRAIGQAEVTLERTPDTEQPGRWGLRTATGYLQLGEVTAVGDDWVTRRVLRRDGTVAPGHATFDAAAFGSDPEARSVEFSEVILAGPEGDQSAWSIPGRDDTWIVFLHDFGEDRTSSLRTAGVTARLGLPMVVPALRGDPGAPSGSGRTSLGASEWRHADAAIRHAIESGAEDIVLVGHGTGASAALVAVQQSRYSSRIVGLVLDGPLLDPALLAEAHLGGSNTPGFLVSWAKAAATFRFGVDWRELDHLSRAAALEVPVLVFHGAEDERFPVEASAVFAGLASDAELVVVPGAGHGEAWNLDPAEYERLLDVFLRRIAVGPTGGEDPAP